MEMYAHVEEEKNLLKRRQEAIVHRNAAEESRTRLLRVVSVDIVDFDKNAIFTRKGEDGLLLCSRRRHFRYVLFCATQRIQTWCGFG